MTSPNGKFDFCEEVKNIFRNIAINSEKLNFFFLHSSAAMGIVHLEGFPE